MSGGHWDYKDRTLREWMFGYCENGISNPLRDEELSRLLYDLFDLIEWADLYQCSNISEQTYNKHKRAFKKKWLSDPDKRVQMVIDAKLAEARKELIETYGKKR